MAFWCWDFFRIVLCWLSVTFTSCNAELPRDVTTLAARDWSDDSHNWHQIMQTLQNTGSRIGIPLTKGIPKQLPFELSQPLLLKVEPYELVIIPCAITPDLAEQLVEVDERELTMFCRVKPGQPTERCEGQEENLRGFFANLRAHGVRVVVPKGRLEKAPVRIADKDSKSVAAV